MDNQDSTIKDSVKRYCRQLQRGCGNALCSNANCASSGVLPPLKPSEITERAVQLFWEGAMLCDPSEEEPKVSHEKKDSLMLCDPTEEQPKVAPERKGSPLVMLCQAMALSVLSDDSVSDTSSDGSSISSISSISNLSSITSTISDNTHTSNSVATSGDDVSPSSRKTYSPSALTESLNKNIRLASVTELAQLDILCQIAEVARVEIEGTETKRPICSFAPANPIFGPVPYLTEVLLDDLLESCKILRNFDRVVQALNEVLPYVGKLGQSFKHPEGLLAKPLRTCGQDQSQDSDILVNFESLRRVKEKLYNLNNDMIIEAINRNVIKLAESIQVCSERHRDWNKILPCLLICFDMAIHTSNTRADLEYWVHTVPQLGRVTLIMPVTEQAHLTRIWAKLYKDQLRALVEGCQLLISLEVVFNKDEAQRNQYAIALAHILKIAFYANILAGTNETCKSHLRGPATCYSNDNNADDEKLESYFPHFLQDRLEEELNVSPMNYCEIQVPFGAFCNEALSSVIKIDRDHSTYGYIQFNPNGEDLHFPYWKYPFLFKAAIKAEALYSECNKRVSSKNNPIFKSLLYPITADKEVLVNFYLKVQVRRENIINDALIVLASAAVNNPKELKKQLVIEFVGEQQVGNDGAVLKEFFQLIVGKILNPEFGMFEEQEGTNTVWFTSAPLVSDAHFTLLGMILGLAIYHNVTVPVNFPMVMYRKLLGRAGTFADLKDLNPKLYCKLRAILDYEESDLEKFFKQTFTFTCENVFGEVVEHELKPGGADIAVTNLNKQEFVDASADYLLNKSIRQQFSAIKKGFDMITYGSLLKILFRPEELELLICGSKVSYLAFDYFTFKRIAFEFKAG